MGLKNNLCAMRLKTRLPPPFPKTRLIYIPNLNFLAQFRGYLYKLSLEGNGESCEEQTQKLDKSAQNLIFGCKKEAGGGVVIKLKNRDPPLNALD